MSNSDRFLLAGVMGWPVMHSRSPILHNYLLKQHRLTGAYVPFAIEPNRLETALRALAPLGFSGCNVTIPHKAHALTIVDAVDPVAKRIGAVSCVVVRPDGTLSGTNNDAFGFMQNVLQKQPAWRADAGPIAVIGAGGGARAIVYSLAERARRPSGGRSQALGRFLAHLVVPRRVSLPVPQIVLKPLIIRANRPLIGCAAGAGPFHR
jgi:shikimate dehydrogenase